MDDCRSKGGHIVMGGKRNESLPGYFYEPTLVSDVNLDMSIATEEIFGPIASIIKYIRIRITEFLLEMNRF